MPLLYVSRSPGTILPFFSVHMEAYAIPSRTVIKSLNYETPDRAPKDLGHALIQHQRLRYPKLVAALGLPP